MGVMGIHSTHAGKSTGVNAQMSGQVFTGDQPEKQTQPSSHYILRVQRKRRPWDLTVGRFQGWNDP